MATSKVLYTGELRTEATHLKSGQSIITDAPPDNQGRGEAFSPTDLAATSLASCMMTIMGIYARERNIDMRGTEALVTKHMAASPRRISGIDVEMHVVLAEEPTENIRRGIENAAMTCPVFLSLHPDIVKNVTFTFTVRN